MKEQSMMARRGRGRGSNPASRENLTPQKHDAFVWNRGSGIGWTCLAGPMPFRAAYSAAMRLENLNATGKQMFAATRSPELLGLVKPGDIRP